MYANTGRPSQRKPEGSAWIQFNGSLRGELRSPTSGQVRTLVAVQHQNHAERLGPALSHETSNTRASLRQSAWLVPMLALARSAAPALRRYWTTKRSSLVGTNFSLPTRHMRTPSSSTNPQPQRASPREPRLDLVSQPPSALPLPSAATHRLLARRLSGMPPFRPLQLVCSWARVHAGPPRLL